ncbi:GCN5 family acetyltransferase [Achromobacter kerstersii]
MWVHPHAGGEDLHEGDDYYYAFATFEEAAECAEDTPGAEQPLVLVRQFESINEPTPGVFEHVIAERITEWRVEWLADSKRTATSIPDFLKSRAH